MIARSLLVAIASAVLAGCGPGTQPDPETPEPVPVEPGPAEPPPDPVEPEPGPVDDWHACHDVEDCVPVGCGCSCSGCGGFSYEDIINRDLEQAWYEEKGCEPASVCPEVCCPALTVVCEDGRCGVVAGKIENVH